MSHRRIELSRNLTSRDLFGQVTEAAKQISTLSAREDEQRKRRQRAEEESDKIRKVKDARCLRTCHRSSSVFFFFFLFVRSVNRKGRQPLHSALGRALNAWKLYMGSGVGHFWKSWRDAFTTFKFSRLRVRLPLHLLALPYVRPDLMLLC